MPYVFNARYALITYAQCGELDPWAVSDHFSEMGAECIIGRELHGDGGTHLHVFVDFGRKYYSRRTDVFDVRGCHPNIEVSRGTPEKGFDYACKDGDVVAGGLERPIPRSPGDVSTRAKWTEIASARDRDEFWSLVFDLDPQRGCCSWTNLSKFADWKFAPEPPRYDTPRGLEFHTGRFDGLNDWVQQSGMGSGQSRVGK